MRMSPAAVACCLLAAVVALAGCREAEQGRVLRYQKGTYLGPKEAPLTDAARESLRQRAQLQGVSATPPGGAPVLSQPVSGPAAGMQGQRQGTDRAAPRESPGALPTETLDTLRGRTRRQRAD